MCGIAGVSDPSLEAAGPNDPRLERMLERLHRRGPDGEGVAWLTGAQIGIRRLAIVGAAAGEQPVWNEDASVALVMNGEIYNHAALRDALLKRGHAFRGPSDAEVVVHLYEERGIEALRALSGMYALALWDGRRAELLLARDPIGQKPLLVRTLGDSVLFASDLRALVAAPGDGVRPDLDPDGLDRYLLYRAATGRRTLIRGIERLQPGEVMRVRDGAVTGVRRVVPPSWPRAASQDGQSRTPQAARRATVDALDRTLAAAVARVGEVSVPAGILLSSGVDSSLVLALLGERARGMPAFVAEWVAAGGADREWQAASALARRMGARPERVAVEPRRLAGDLTALVALLDEPLADPTALPLFATVRAAAPEVRVLLSGEGADELFAGYPGYREPGLAAALAAFAGSGPGRAAAAFLSRHGLRGAGLLWRATTPVAARYLGPGATFDRDARATLYARGWPGPALDAEILARVRARRYDDGAWLAAMRAVDRGVWLADEALAKLDRVTMGHGVEARAPYLEPDVVALADSMPPDLLIGPGVGKRVLREVARRHLPQGYAMAKKRGFGVPLTRLMHGEWRDLAHDTVLAPTASVSGLFDPVALRAVFAPAPGHQRPARARERYALLVLEMWLRSVLVPAAARGLTAGEAPACDRPKAAAARLHALPEAARALSAEPRR